MNKLFAITDRHWKKLMWLPLIALALSIILLAHTAATTGFILHRDIELTGGKQVIATVGELDVQKLQQLLPESKIQVTTGTAKTVYISVPFDANETEVVNILRQAGTIIGEPTVRSIGPVLGELFFTEALRVFIASFVLMSIVVFILFRSPAPSAIVIMSVVVDIGVTLGIMNLAGIELSIPVLAALLMLIGYSVDTDILLTANVLRSREMTIQERVSNGVKTGLTMTATTLVALSALYFISGSLVLQRIALVLMIGLVVDVFATWFTNVGILRWYVERKRT